MGQINFLLPAGLTPDAVRELQRASVAGGQDVMPYPTDLIIDNGQMSARRTVDESGALLAPWRIDGAGCLMLGSATLMERLEPYHLPMELARGKVNQLRGQAADWLMGGLCVSGELAEQLHQANRAFTRAVAQDGLPSDAQAALTCGCQAADRLVAAYIQQVFEIRHQRQPRLDTLLGCRLRPPAPAAELAQAVSRACNAYCLEFPWNEIEPAEGDYHWAPFDELVDWASAQGLALSGGPLVDFSGVGLPDWLWQRQRDLAGVAVHLSGWVETVLQRYGSRIRTWHITAATNASQVLAVTDEELMWLAVRLAEVARQVDAAFEIVLGITQPWGDYLTVQDHTHSPFVFADTIVRTGLKLAALDLEVIMGVTPRGSYCRDLLDLSRILDLYALLGVPVQVTLGYPSATGDDPQADADLQVRGGWWRDGCSLQVQADWAGDFATLAVCKPYVRAVHWAHVQDAQPHFFPHCGLVDADGRVKPALDRLRALRQAHLR